MKRCEFCGKEMVRPRWSNGRLDDTWKHRRFCSSRCYGDWIISQNRAKRLSGRRRAHRLITKMEKCDVCGSRSGLQRHHRDRNPLNNELSNLQILCQTCHKNDHMRDGTWGTIGFKNRIFRELQSALRNASTDLKDSEMPSSRKSHSKF